MSRQTTYSRPKTSLHPSYTLILPRLCQHIKHILVHPYTTVLRELPLELHTCLCDIRDIRERHLHRHSQDRGGKYQFDEYTWTVDDRSRQHE